MSPLEQILRQIDPQYGTDNKDNNALEKKAKSVNSLKQIGLAAPKSALDGLETSKTPKIATPSTPIKSNLTAEALDKGIGVATQSLGAIAGIANDLSGNNYDTSAQGGGVRNLGVMELGAKGIEGFAQGAAIGGPIAGAGLGAAKMLISALGNKSAKKEYTKNLQEFGAKQSYLDKIKLEKETAIQEGKNQLFDLQAIRKKQLGYV